MLSRLIALTPVCALTACGITPQRPVPPVFDGQATFSSAYALAPADADTWWATALPTSLATRVDAVVATSPTLMAAAADVDAAQAALRQATADRGPDLSTGADIDVTKTSSRGSDDSRSAVLDANLPLDFSGALRERERAARLTLVAVRADLQRQRTDLVLDLLLAVVDAAEAKQRRTLLDRQIELTETLLRLTELRFTQGLASGVDVLQQRDQLAALRQQIPTATLDAQTALNRVRALAGQTPDRAAPIDLDQLPAVSDRFASIQPIDLLWRRPVLRAAGARLESADARFAAALADRWPAFDLSAAALTRTLSGDATTIVNAALNATLTVFDGGRKIAIAEQRRAELTAAGHALLDDWINTVIETDTLIHEELSLQERIELSRQRLITAEALLTATQRRYERGVSDYLPVLEALRGLQQQQRADLALRAELHRARVRLHHALGSAAGDEA